MVALEEKIKMHVNQHKQSALRSQSHLTTLSGLYHPHQWRNWKQAITTTKPPQISVLISFMGRVQGYLHNVGCHCTARNDDHQSRLDLVIGVQQAFTCQVHQHTCHHPDAQDGQQGPRISRDTSTETPMHKESANHLNLPKTHKTLMLHLPTKEKRPHSTSLSHLQSRSVDEFQY